jgi:NAD-dependent deacetylase
MPPDALAAARERLRAARTVVVLTGAGVSAESGVPTFRGEGGLWRNHRPEELATPEAFARDPCLVWEWYGMRRATVAACSPNEGHRALARWCLEDPERRTLVTQNVDGLHERALVEAAPGGRPPEAALPLTLHGSLVRVRCTACAFLALDEGVVDARSAHTLPHCPRCRALLRPDVVWFGEALDAAVLERAFDAARGAEACVVVGTSAVVHPAAAIPEVTRSGGGALIEVNPDPTPLSARALHRLRGPAGSILPLLLA